MERAQPRLKPEPDFRHELEAAAKGHRIVAGIDEAGRGPLAGPVVAAAVVLPPGLVLPGLNDSKLLDRAKRAALFARITVAAQVGIGLVPAAVIDRINIRAATLLAMCRALAALPGPVDFALVDGRDFPEGLRCPGQAVIGGDGQSASIAAASIVAKVLRDRLMGRAEAHFPGYGFAVHAGYAVPAHRAALDRLGPCALHRRGFAPVQKRNSAAPAR